MKRPSGQPQSRFRSVVNAIGSAKVAVIELLGLGLVCVIASFGTGGAGALPSHPFWMTAIVLFLAITLVCVTLARWPWRFQDAGFVGVHFGLVLILAGGMIERRYGFETQLRMHAAKPVNETQMIFANDNPVVVQREKSVPSGVKIALHMVQDEPTITLKHEGDSCVNLPVSRVMGKAFRWTQKAPLTLRVREYWPDFAMSPAGPILRSSIPNNPAVLIELVSDTTAPIQTVHQTGTKVKLLRFEVAKDSKGIPEDFRSVLQLTDMAGTAPVQTMTSVNHPVSYPPGFWRTALGLNTRFLQAGWNPADLQESTLQVKRDPGWPFQWIGVVLFCCGLAGHYFFLKPS